MMDVIGETSIDQRSPGTQAVVVSYPTFKICEVKMDRSEAVRSFQEQNKLDWDESLTGLQTGVLILRREEERKNFYSIVRTIVSLL